MQYIISDSTSEIPVFNHDLVRKIAHDWVHLSAGVKNGNQVMVMYDVGGRQLAKEVARLCAEQGARVWYRVRELEMDSVLYETLPKRELARYLAFINNEIMQADVVFFIRCARDPNIMQHVPSDQRKIISTAERPVLIDYRVNHTNWQLIYWPTPTEAEIEEMTFEEYVELFFEACDQPWSEIKKAQEKLVDILDRAETLTLIADPNNPDPDKRTHLEVGIKNMDFINSTIDSNYPGSEVFSSPEIDKVDGQVYAIGKRALAHENKIVEDVFLKAEKGKIIEARAGKGQDDLDELLDRDEGARRFGEVAIGTNPGLRRRLFNGLLNEKVGGSFHITPGNSYEFTEHDGKPVNLHNGNKSEIHWDLTISMLPEEGGGEIVVDGKTIQKDGRFVVEGLEILNRGL